MAKKLYTNHYVVNLFIPFDEIDDSDISPITSDDNEDENSDGETITMFISLHDVPKYIAPQELYESLIAQIIDGFNQNFYEQYSHLLSDEWELGLDVIIENMMLIHTYKQKKQ